MFWRQATNAKILVDAYGKALVYASAGSEYNDCCIAYRSDSDTVAVAEIVMVEGIDNWGSTEITVTTEDNVRSFTVDGTTYSFTDGGAITPELSEWHNPLNYRVNGSSYWIVDRTGKLVVVSVNNAKRVFSANTESEGAAEEGGFESGEMTDEQIAEFGWGSNEVSGENLQYGSFDFIIDGVPCHFDNDYTRVDPHPIPEYQP